MRCRSRALYSRLNPGDRQPIISGKMPGINSAKKRKGSLLVVDEGPFIVEYLAAALRGEG
jgi:hypothetical protein